MRSATGSTLILFARQERGYGMYRLIRCVSIFYLFLSLSMDVLSAKPARSKSYGRVTAEAVAAVRSDNQELSEVAKKNSKRVRKAVAQNGDDIDAIMDYLEGGGSLEKAVSPAAGAASSVVSRIPAERPAGWDAVIDPAAWTADEKKRLHATSEPRERCVVSRCEWAYPVMYLSEEQKHALQYAYKGSCTVLDEVAAGVTGGVLVGQLVCSIMVAIRSPRTQKTLVAQHTVYSSPHEYKCIAEKLLGIRSGDVLEMEFYACTEDRSWNYQDPVYERGVCVGVLPSLAILTGYPLFSRFFSDTTTLIIKSFVRAGYTVSANCALYDLDPESDNYTAAGDAVRWVYVQPRLRLTHVCPMVNRLPFYTITKNETSSTRGVYVLSGKIFITADDPLAKREEAYDAYHMNDRAIVNSEYSFKQFGAAVPVLTSPIAIRWVHIVEVPEKWHPAWFARGVDLSGSAGILREKEAIDIAVLAEGAC